MSAPTPFDMYVAPARARRSAWRVIGATLVIGLVWMLWVVAVILASVAYDIVANGTPPALAMENSRYFLTAGTPLSILAVMSSFLGVWIGLWLALKLLHNRPFGTLFSPERRIRWREFSGGFLLSAAFFVLSVGVALILFGAPARSELSFGIWAIWIIPLIVGVFFQATAEELLFRGYFLQQLAAWSRSPVIWAVLPSLFFGTLHLNPGLPLVANLLVVGITFLVGVIAAALVWRTGSLAAAMGLHVGVNVQALALVGAAESPLSGGQLWLFDAGSATALYTIDAVSVVALLALILSPWNPVKAQATADALPQFGEAGDRSR